jgi:hypothetical protein
MFDLDSNIYVYDQAERCNKMLHQKYEKTCFDPVIKFHKIE